LGYLRDYAGGVKRCGGWMSRSHPLPSNSSFHLY
jgi:hypothetical protein